MAKIKKIFLSSFAIIVATILAYLAILRIPSNAQLSVNQSVIQKGALQCFNNKAAKPIDRNGELQVLVWNIYKQARENWHETLEQYSHNTHLALLQEVSMTEQFKAYANSSAWFSSHVDAFSAFGVSSGVLTLSIQSPLVACAHVEVEPWILLPKSGIYSVFQLSDQRELVVVNVHAVNFTYGIEEYKQQISALSAALTKHQGPVIFAGDLNTWSLERFAIIEIMLKQLGLIEVEFSPDNRTQFVNGMALDYIFYRELELVNALSPATDASDHNPLVVKFRL